ncbi:Hypothetical protein ABZS17G119_03978 [Kosakonia cowanii]
MNKTPVALRVPGSGLRGRIRAAPATKTLVFYTEQWVIISA